MVSSMTTQGFYYQRDSKATHHPRHQDSRVLGQDDSKDGPGQDRISTILSVSNATFKTLQYLIHYVTFSGRRIFYYHNSKVKLNIVKLSSLLLLISKFLFSFPDNSTFLFSEFLDLPTTLIQMCLKVETED